MAIPEETRDYVDGQIGYYVAEAESYRQLAESFAGDGSVEDAAFGVIAGCVYSAFLQACQARQRGPSLEEVRELGAMIRARAGEIRGAVSGGRPAGR